MAAALIAQVMDSPPRVIENAAESALEHHLGMTCDPVAGYVQVPCIERCAFGAVKAWTAAMIATNEIASRHRVDLDTTIKTLADTARDMNCEVQGDERSRVGAELGPLLSSSAGRVAAECDEPDDPAWFSGRRLPCQMKPLLLRTSEAVPRSKSQTIVRQSRLPQTAAKRRIP